MKDKAIAMGAIAVLAGVGVFLISRIVKSASAVDKTVPDFEEKEAACAAAKAAVSQACK